MDEELKRQGYGFEYKRDTNDGWIEVWTNNKSGWALRIEWIRMDATGR